MKAADFKGTLPDFALVELPDFAPPPQSIDSTRTLLYWDKLDSTSNAAKELGELPEGAEVLLVTRNQTRGRGRPGNAWHSEPDAALTFTLVLELPFGRRDTEILSLLFAVVLCETVDSLLPDECRCDLKWPNDLLIDSKKCAGILLENRVMNSRTRIMAGTGINLKAMSFPADLIRPATWLENHTHRPVSAAELLAVYLDRFAEWYSAYLEGNYPRLLQKYENSSTWVREKDICWREGSRELHGRTTGLDPRGALLCLSESGERLRLTVSEIREARAK